MTLEQLQAVYDQIGPDEKDTREAIHNAAELEVGRAYWVQTAEPAADIRAGKFLGFMFDGDTPRVDLPDDWDEQYPDLVFENVIFPDHWALTAWPVEPE